MVQTQLNDTDDVEEILSQRECGACHHAKAVDIITEIAEAADCQQSRILLQIWAYEMDDSRLTLTEKLEKSKWEKAGMGEISIV